MADTLPSLKLTSDGAMKLLNAAMAKAKEMGVPQCISIVDSGGHLLAFARMDGAFSQSIDTSLMKAMTAASYGIPTGDIAAGIDLKLALGTHGKRAHPPPARAAQAPAPAGRAADHRRRPRHRRDRRGVGHRRAGQTGSERRARRAVR